MTQHTKIENIIKKYDLVKLISSVLEVKRSGSGFFSKCPFHNENTASFYINKNNQRYYCFGCHKTGNIINFIMEYKKCDFTLALKIISKEKIYKEHTTLNEKDKIFDYLNKILSNSNCIADNFIKARGLQKDSILKFKLGFIPSNLEKITNNNLKNFLTKIGLINKDGINVNRIFKNRIIIPIRNIKGDYIGIGGRTIYNNLKPKYINSPESEIFAKKKSLYGIYEAKNINNDLIIVEGYLDVIKLHQFNITNVVAILGTAFSKDHLLILKSFCKKITFCFDGDKAGQLASIKSAFMCLPFLFDFKLIRFTIMPNNFDPDSFITIHGRSKFIYLLSKSVSLIDFVFLSMNIKITDFNFFFKINKIIENIDNLFIKKFIINYLSNSFYFSLSNFNHNDVIPIFIKACIFILKKRYLIYKINLKKILTNKNIFFNNDIRIFLDLCFLIKNNLNVNFSNLNKRLIKKIKLKHSTVITLINKMPIEVLENEFLSILKKIELYK